MAIFAKDQIEELRLMCTKLYSAEENGITYIKLEGLKVPPDAQIDTVDALFCPTAKDGYTSRLYFSKKLKSQRYDQLNWNADGVMIMGHVWYAYSWQIQSPDLRLIQLVCAHLNAKK